MRKKLSIVLLLSLITGFSAAWTPERFQVYCGEPYGYSDEFSFKPASFFAELQTLNPRSHWYYSSLFGESDPDISGDADCISQTRKTLIEGYAAEILQELKTLGFKASPKPKRLGPVVSTPQGQAIRLFAMDDYAGFASTISPCEKDGKVDDARLSIIRFNTDKFNNSPKPMIYYMLAHELVHVVQFAQASVLESDTCGLPSWLGEGTADAIATYLTQRKFNYSPPITTGIGGNMHGLRPYNKNLAWIFKPKKVGYRTSSFWRYLAERYYGNKFEYLSDYLAIPSDKDDWFDWLDDQLRTSDGGPKKPLYLIYPDFVANYANWGKLKFRTIKEGTWLGQSFGGCRQINLSPQQPKQGLTLELEPISAQCIKVNVGGVKAGEVVKIKLMAYDDTTDDLDNLHLSAAYLKGKVISIGSDFNCYRDAQRYSRSTCGSLPFIGDASAQIGPSGQYVKTWLSESQEVLQNDFKNLFMVSHVPVNPSQQKHANQVKQEVILQIALEHTALTTTARGTAKKVQSRVGTGGEDLGNVGLSPIGGNGGFLPAALSEVLGQVDSSSGGAMAQLPFQMNLPNVEGLIPYEGFRIITLEEFDIETNEYGNGEIKPNYMISLMLKEPIEFGATGSYKAFVSAGLVSETIDMSSMVLKLSTDDEPTGQIDVHEFSEELLSMTVSGSYCVIANYDFDAEVCRKTESFSAKIIKPFGWLYATNGFSSIDTPGTALYKDDFYRYLTDFGLPLPPQDSTNNNPPNDTNSSVNGIGMGLPTNQVAECECSCEEFELFTNMAESFDSQPQDGQNMSMPPAAAQMMQCLGTCMMQYATCQ